MSVPRGTTPTFTLDFSLCDIDFTQAENVYVTFSGRRTITKQDTALDIEAKRIYVYLTQAETLSFKEDEEVAVQVNWTYAGGRRSASEVATVVFTKQLLNMVVE